ncbi:MAG: FAD-binding oxidoreductase [Saprospiraceae bacterium]|nr:FAD-binding oxidoreductase [Saprospiraceae bacterium]
MKILIVGHGIAGAVLAYTLSDKGADVYVADVDLPGRSSMPAAGIINPVTGKRFVKSWNFDLFFDSAVSFYKKVESEAGKQLFFKKPIFRLLHTAAEANDWSGRSVLPDYAGLMSDRKDAGNWSDAILPTLMIGELKQSARVDFSLLIQTLAQRWVQQGRLISDYIHPDDTSTMLKEYDRIVFCEGYRAEKNTLFPGLKWLVAKGEALLVHFPGWKLPVGLEMIKKGILLAPVSEQLCWAGGSYAWNFTDVSPTAEARQFLQGHLQQMLRIPYEIAGQVAGVRPTVQDRRPLLGESSVRKNVFLFNGFGTKGALLAPFWADHLSRHLLNGTELDPVVDIRRYR